MTGLQQAAIYISASGGGLPYLYNWSGTGEYTALSEDIENLGEGMYNLDLTDANGCITNFQQAIVDEDPISLSYTLSSYEEYNLECFGDSSGSIKIDTVTGNGLDCWSDVTISLTAPDPIFISYDSVINNPCINSADGAIFITLSKGELPFQFSWTGPDDFTST